jgi:hypothetical protein
METLRTSSVGASKMVVTQMHLESQATAAQRALQKVQSDFDAYQQARFQVGSAGSNASSLQTPSFASRSYRSSCSYSSRPYYYKLEHVFSKDTFASESRSAALQEPV